MKKVCCVITNRASYSKFKSLLIHLKKDKKINLQLVVAAGAFLEKYGRLDKEIKKDGFKISEKIHMLLESQTLLSNAKSTGIGISEFSSCFDRIKPDLLVLMADRFEILSAAIAASYQNIRIAHIQGGEVSGNIDQKVRYAVTQLSDYHFPSTKKANQNLVRILNSKKNIFLTGCPSIDLCKEINKKSYKEFLMISNYLIGVGHKVNLKKDYVIVLQHPVTNEYGQGKNQVLKTMNSVLKLNLQTIWFWPNPDSGNADISKFLRRFREMNFKDKILFVKNINPQQFLLLLKYARCIIGNSSAGIRESSFLGTPSVNIGSRQKNRERGKNVISVNYDQKKIFKKIKFQIGKKYKKDNLYGSGNAGLKIYKRIKSILSTKK